MTETTIKQMNPKIFQTLTKLFPNDFQWIDDLEITPELMDTFYIFHSGDKFLLSKFVPILDNNETYMYEYIRALFYSKWNRYWETLVIDYIPNEDIKTEYKNERNLRDYTSENNSADSVISQKDKLINDTFNNVKDNEIYQEIAKNNSDNLKSSVNKQSDSVDNMNGYFGFNSTMPVPQQTQSDNNLSVTNNDDYSKETENNNVIRDNNASQKSQTTSTQDSENITTNGNNEKRYRDYTKWNKDVSLRTGLSGNNTNQELIIQELELRKTLFLDIVMDDIDSAIALSCY